MAKPKRGVVAVDTDGSIKWYFESRSEAEKYTRSHHRDMGNALKNRYYTLKGYKWYYESDYRDGWMRYGEEYFSWEPSETHRRFGSGFLKGHKLGNGYERWSEEAKKRRSDIARMVCLKRKENNGYVESGKKLRKPVICITDSMTFESIKHAAQHYEIPANQISASITRNGTVRNLKFNLV